MLTGQSYLYEKAEDLTTEFAQEIRDQRKEGRGSIEGLLIYARARMATVIEVLEAIEKLGNSRPHQG